MQRSRYSFVLDLQSTVAQICLVASLGDTSREFAITFSDGGIPFNLDGTETVEIYIKGLSGTHRSMCDLVKIDAEDDSADTKYFVHYVFTKKTCAFEGMHNCQLNIYDALGNLWSPSFNLFVGPIKESEGDIILPPEEEDALKEIWRAESERKLAEALRQEAESVRVYAEEKREQFAESLREAKENGEFDGYTPQRGVDYFTESDKKDFIDRVLEEMPESGITEEVDPTVPSWAKQPTKPSYTASEVGARPNTWMPTAADVGARPITWTPTAAEVGARPSSWTPTAAEVGAVPTTRKVNGQSLSADVNFDIPDSLAELTDDAAHRTVSDTEKSTWNNKSDFSGSYNDLKDKPSIPSVTGLASTDYVDRKVASLVDSSPEALNTLSELAASLGNDPNFATTVSENIGKKVDKTTTVNGHPLSGNVTVSKSDVGLGNVPNVATNDQTPTFTETSELANINTGEKISTIFGKIKKAITDLVAHIASKSNPHSVTKTQLGLDNVENKSSETIRSEITLQNVSKALGIGALQTESKEIVGAINEVNSKTIDKINHIHTATIGEAGELTASPIGIQWDEMFSFEGEGGYTSGDISQCVPIVAGDNVTFEIEGAVVKINAKSITVDDVIAALPRYNGEVEDV